MPRGWDKAVSERGEEEVERREGEGRVEEGSVGERKGGEERRGGWSCHFQSLS